MAVDVRALMRENGIPPEEDAETGDGADLGANRMVSGGSFIFDEPADVQAVWGEGTEVLWPDGEPCMIAGNIGAGKTSVAGQLVRGLVVGDQDVLGYPVRQAQRVLYLAMDRPKQISRALRRQLGGIDRAVLDDRLVFWKGPPPVDLAVNTLWMLHEAQAEDAEVVIIDSLKDTSGSLTKDENGIGLNRAIQHLIAEGINVLVLHHNRKASADNKRPSALDDLYGSTWIPSGCGSVLFLFADGKAGSDEVELLHLKPSVDLLPPLRLRHDHDEGETDVLDGVMNVTEEMVLKVLPHNGEALTVASIAERVGVNPADKAAKKRIERVCKRAAKAGRARVEPGVKGGVGGGTPARYGQVTLL